MRSSSDPRKRSWFFFFPASAWPHQQEAEEQGAALVPSSSSSSSSSSSHDDGDEQPLAGPAAEQVINDPAAEGPLIVENEKATKEPAAAGGGSSSSSSRSSSSAAWWRWRVVPAATRGMGLVIGGLVVLAVLLATTTTWWTHLDYSSSSFLLGQESGSGRPPPRHHNKQNLQVPIPFSCEGNYSNNNNGHQVAAMAPAPAPWSDDLGLGRRPPPPAPRMCPDYFRHIHSDLAPWRETGITREAVESGRGRAAFRLTVVGGRAFVETYHRVFQTRDTFTQWGIAQLLARYPGRVPDLDLMFNCEDMPEVPVGATARPRPRPPPPLFRYCKDDAHLDIVFPDWSFWGWPEVNIRPWAPLLEEMANETRHLRPWPADREPYAFWKGNPGVSPLRQNLMRCNDARVRVFRQDWVAAIRAGFRDSNLARQCRYRYKIFVQGRSWSVSEKYILACDSPTLLVDTPFRDFVSRGLVAGRHYWPIDRNNMCPAIDFAVDWGNEHQDAARRMAAEGSAFARRDLAMDYVYDYMLHLLTQYAKLLRYKPTVPEGAVELRPETVACPSRGRPREFDFMMQSRERFVAAAEPCALPPPFTPQERKDMARREKQVRAQVAKMMISNKHKKHHR